jgi:hypothetical protein
MNSDPLTSPATDDRSTVIWWVIIIFIIIIVIGIIIFVVIDQFDRSSQPSQLQQPVDGTCLNTSDCLPGLTCLNSICSVPAVAKGRIGDACQTVTDCTTGLDCGFRTDLEIPNQSTICLATINPPPIRDIGSNCLTDGDCFSNLTCQNSVCKAKIDSACTKLEDCVSHATVCLRTTNTCSAQPLPNSGDSCSNLPCSTNLICQGNICRSQIGGICLDDSGCTIDSGGCRNGLCVPAGTGGLNQSCSLPDNPCSDSLICDQRSGNLCKISDGVNCSQDGDCRIGSTCRIDHKYGNRYGNTGRVCLPTHQLFEYCTTNTECQSGVCGDSRLMAQIDNQLQPVHRIQNQLADVICDENNLLMLLGDGNIMKEIRSLNGKSHRLEMIKNNLTLEKLVSIGGSRQCVIYGLSRGRLHKLNRYASSPNSWIWELVDWAPSHITHLNCSHDGNYLWLQTPIRHPSPTLPSGLETPSVNDHKQYGYLYRFLGTEEELALVKQSMLAEGVNRIYGRNEICYLEVDTINHRAIRCPKGDMIEDYHVGILMSDGSVYKVGSERRNEIRDAKLIRGIPHLITHRQCLSTVEFSTNFSSSSYSALAISPVSNEIEISYLQP